MTLRVAVLGAGGRMGGETCRAVEADDELELVARIGRKDSLEQLVDAMAEVVVEFTTPDAVKDNVSFCLGNRMHVVVGTTGLTTEALDELRARSDEHGANCFVAPNFAIGAVLMMRFAAQASAHFDVAEIIERHNEHKLDAPSGTALRTAKLMNDARAKAWVAPTAGRETLEHVRGGDQGGIRVHSLRTPGSVAHQEVILASAGQTLSIRHDSIDRSSFMPGVVLAIKKVSSLDGLTVGLEHLLDF